VINGLYTHQKVHRTDGYVMDYVIKCNAPRATLTLRELGFDGTINLINGEKYLPDEWPRLSKPGDDGISLMLI